eukprot:CAMPEP_0183419502 /NCGR_PEP_ID=MMETSP0370-20130417/25832_1 /TAXON_ID=268820 /ORGANISM="Peridinium aciculiferum, Strain PAER-2" /LENGTH=39 /DNA_ID= /DNA_START= /DNA_END= /DNA_ORIENTATION=
MYMLTCEVRAPRPDGCLYRKWPEAKITTILRLPDAAAGP